MSSRKNRWICSGDGCGGSQIETSLTSWSFPTILTTPCFVETFLDRADQLEKPVGRQDTHQDLAIRQKEVREVFGDQGEQGFDVFVLVPSDGFRSPCALHLQWGFSGRHVLYLQETDRDLRFQLGFQNAKGQLQPGRADLSRTDFSSGCSLICPEQAYRADEEAIRAGREGLLEKDDRNVEKSLQIAPVLR